jgi:hypothetical protein
LKQNSVAELPLESMGEAPRVQRRAEYRTASLETCARRKDIAMDLLEKVLSRENLTAALKRVEANKGAAGVDGVSTEQRQTWGSILGIGILLAAD